MGKARSLRGKATQGDMPDWTPLVGAVGQRAAGDFMWMFDVELANGRFLQAYKHIDTRRYVHLDGDCGAFVFEPPDRYAASRSPICLPP
jgi:hypothetical protein